MGVASLIGAWWIEIPLDAAMIAVTCIPGLSLWLPGVFLK